MTAERTIGIMTALPLERDAVVRVFGAKRLQPSAKGLEYWVAHVEPEAGERLRIVIGCSGRSGNTEVVWPTADMIHAHKPECLLLVGIACAVKKIPYCSIVTSECVYGYDYVKSLPDGILNRARAKSVSSDMGCAARSMQRHVQDWVTQLGCHDVKLENPAKFELGTWIASGSVVMADGRLEAPPRAKRNPEGEKALRQSPEILAGEMEAYGFAEACERAGKRWLVIRGVSDHGDGTKDNPRTKDEMHAPASLSAAVFAKLLLERCYVGHPRVVPTTPLRRYLVSRIEQQSDRDVDRLLARHLSASHHVADFVAMVADECRACTARRFVALCGRKNWGYELATSYYRDCLDWAKARKKDPNAAAPDDQIPSMGIMTRIFVEPKEGFSKWDRHVLMEHHRTAGVKALVIHHEKLESLLRPVGDDIVNDGLGLVAIDKGTRPLLGSNWCVLAHAGDGETFRFAKMDEDYTAYELMRLLATLVHQSRPFEPTKADQRLPWPPEEAAYTQAFSANGVHPKLATPATLARSPNSTVVETKPVSGPRGGQTPSGSSPVRSRRRSGRT